MNKPLTLNQAWTKCLRMWKWIAAIWKPGDDVSHLKIKWIDLHEPEKYVDCDCYFCEYDEQHPNTFACRFCPAKLIDKSFRCFNPNYSWEDNPQAFYGHILGLHKIYKEGLNKKRKGGRK